MEREPLIEGNSYLESISSNNTDPVEVERSHTSYFSVIDLENDIATDRVLQLALLLEKSAKQLRHHAKFAEKERTVSPKRKQKLPPRITENLFPITALWQVLCIIALTAVDYYDAKIEDRNITYKLGVALACAFQFANLVLVLSATIKLTKQYLHKTASTRFLINGYFSIMILFAGLYLLIYKIKPECFLDFANKKDKHIERWSAVLFIKMLNLSISTGTLCGAANITANDWYSGLVMSFQMLLSFIYFASFLSHVLSPSTIGSTVRKRYQRRSELRSTKDYGSV